MGVQHGVHISICMDNGPEILSFEMTPTVKSHYIYVSKGTAVPVTWPPFCQLSNFVAFNRPFIWAIVPYLMIRARAGIRVKVWHARGLGMNPGVGIYSEKVRSKDLVE